MTDTTTTTQQAGAPDPAPQRAPAPPRLRRRPALAGLALALVALGGMAAAWLATSMDTSTPVVVAARDVSRGQVLAAEDLRVANLGGLPAGWALPGPQVSAAVGQTATTDLPEGMPVPPSSLTTQPLPRPGMSVIGIKLAPGQLPTVPLRPGDRVRVVGTPRTQDDPPASAPAWASAVVASTSVDETSGHTVVNVEMPAQHAAGVAALAATGRVALILDSAAG